MCAPATKLVRSIAIEPPLAGNSEYTIAVERGRLLANARVLLALADPADVNAPALLQQDLVLDGNGSASLNLSLPNRADLQGQTLYLRVFVEDAAAAGGWSSSASVSFQLLEINDLVYGQGFED